MKARAKRMVAPAVIGALVISCSAPPASAPPAEPLPVGQLTPLLDTTLSAPRWFTGTDGQAHLVYELQLINVARSPLTVSGVGVRDADSGASLMELTDDSLRAATSLAAAPEVPTVTLPPSSVGVVWLDVPLGGTRIPGAVTHRISVDPPADFPQSDIAWTFTGDAVSVDQRPPVVIGPPLTGPGWAALGSCCDGPHRRGLYPINGQWYLAQRFAIDFNQLDAQNRPGVGDPLSPDSFPTFGQSVLAVADGAVVVAADGDPDLRVNEPREEPTPQNAGGNRVVIDIGDGRFAVYAHLRKDSIAVREGDRVTRGQRIAEVGSSGTTGGPHLHFQVTDRPSVVFADGMPYVLSAFKLTGQTPPLRDVLEYYDTLEPIPISTERVGERHDQMPLGRDVVTFPAS